MANELRIVQNTNGITYANKKLASATRRILDTAEKMERGAYSIATIIAEVARTECFREDGFKSVHSWTEHAFGLAKSMSYNLLKIGSEFTTEVYDESGKKIGMISRIRGNSDIDYSVTQLIQLLPIGLEKAQELAEEGIINPHMSVSELKKAIEPYKQKKKKAAIEQKEETPETEESIELDSHEISDNANSDEKLLEAAKKKLTEAIGLVSRMQNNEKNCEIMEYLRECVYGLDDILAGHDAS